MCIVYLYFFFFFFSSRSRHTRWNCDWSSDVCSSDLHPPSTGPSTGATTTPKPHTANAWPCLAGGKDSNKIACESGCSAPPPAPCKIRATINTPRVGAMPHKTEAAVKITTHARKNRLRPKKDENHALAGSTIAFEIR